MRAADGLDGLGRFEAFGRDLRVGQEGALAVLVVGVQAARIDGGVVVVASLLAARCARGFEILGNRRRGARIGLALCDALIGGGELLVVGGLLGGVVALGGFRRTLRTGLDLDGARHVSIGVHRIATLIGVFVDVTGMHRCASQDARNEGQDCRVTHTLPPVPDYHRECL